MTHRCETWVVGLHSEWHPIEGRQSKTSKNFERTRSEQEESVGDEKTDSTQINRGLTLEALPPRGPGSAKDVQKETRIEQEESVGDEKTDSTQIKIWIKKLGETLHLPQTSRANPVQCYSTHQEKHCTSERHPIEIDAGTRPKVRPIFCFTTHLS